MLPAGLAAIEEAKRSRHVDAARRRRGPGRPGRPGGGVRRPTARPRDNWDAFSRSARRALLEWIVQADAPETRAKRIAETAEAAARNERANAWVPPDQRPASGR